MNTNYIAMNKSLIGDVPYFTRQCFRTGMIIEMKSNNNSLKSTFIAILHEFIAMYRDDFNTNNDESVFNDDDCILMAMKLPAETVKSS